MSKIKERQTYKVKDTCPEIPMRGKIGAFIKTDPFNNLGLDFGEKIEDYTWSLDGSCPKMTGRYMSRDECTLILGDWDE